MILLLERGCLLLQLSCQNLSDCQVEVWKDRGLDAVIASEFSEVIGSSQNWFLRG